MKSFFLLLFLTSSAFALNETRFSRLCEDLTNSKLQVESNCLDLEAVIPTASEAIPVNLSSNLIKYNFLVKSIEDSSKAAQAKINGWSQYTRFLKKKIGHKFHSADPDFDYSIFNEPHSELLRSFNEIKDVNTQMSIANNKLQICYRVKCNRSRVIQLDDDHKSIKKYYDFLLVKNPWFIGDETEEFLAAANFKEMEQFLLESIVRMIVRLQGIVSDSNVLKRELNLNIETGIVDFDSLLIGAKYHNKRPTIDTALERKLAQWVKLSAQEKDALCELANDRLSYDDKVATLHLGIDVGLTASILVPLPISLLFRSRNLMSMSRVVRTSSQAGLSYSLYERLDEKDNECTGLLTSMSFEENLVALDQYRKCLDQESDLEVAFMLGIIPYEAILKIPGAISKLKILERRGIVPVRHFKTNLEYNNYIGSISKSLAKGDVATVKVVTPANKNVTITNLGATNSTSPLINSSYADEYWSFVSKVYTKRLNLTPQTIKDFFKSIQSSKDRTTLMTVTEKVASKSKNKFRGGVAMVRSSNYSELLPLEKATDFVVPRTPGKKVVEAVRLTIAKGEDPGLLKDFLSQMARVTLVDKNVETVYFYTSKIHHRLYRSAGVKGEVVGRPNEGKHVIVAISRDELKEFL